MLTPSCGPDYTYAHVTGRIKGQTWSDLPMDQVWEIFCQYLRDYVRPGGPHVNAFVLMSNHFHLLITDKEIAVKDFARNIASRVEEIVCGSNQAAQPLFESIPEQFLITDLKHLRYVYRYIYQNPVAAGLSRRAEDYPFSSLGFLLAKTRDLSRPPVNDTFGVIYDPWRMLKWINEVNSIDEFWQLH